EIEVLLGVVGEAPGLGRQQRDVRNPGEESVLQGSHQKRAGPARSSHGPVSVGAHVTARRGTRSAGGTWVPSSSRDMIVVGLTGGIGSGQSTDRKSTRLNSSH